MGALPIKNPAVLCSYFGFDLIDYNRDGNGLLISSGAGIMMAIMDAVPNIRWCIDIDSHRQIRSRVPNLMVALDHCELDFIAVAGFFSNDSPVEMAQGIVRLRNTYCPQYSGGYKVFPDESATLAAFIDDCKTTIYPDAINVGAA